MKSKEWNRGDTCYIYDSYMKCRRPAKVMEKYDSKQWGYNLSKHYIVEFDCHVDCWLELVNSFAMFEDLE